MIKLINGDCLEEMKNIKDGSIDCILTDPPYGMSYVSNYRKNKYSPIIGDSNLTWLDEFVNVSYKVLKENRGIFVFCSWHNVDVFKKAIEKKFKIKNILVWEKNNTGMGDLKGAFAAKYELCIFATKGRVILKGKREPDIIKFKRTNNKLHPTQKPIDMLEYLLSKSTDDKSIVLDCFMGSGSTGVAAVNTNRNFIGIELDKNYFEIAQQRIKEAQHDNL